MNMKNELIEKEALKEVLRYGILYCFVSGDKTEDRYDVLTNFILSQEAKLLYGTFVKDKDFDKTVALYKELDMYKAAIAEILVYLEGKFQDEVDYKRHLDESAPLNVPQKFYSMGKLESFKEVLKFVEDRIKKED